jgi:hypothetical protein
LHNLLQPQTQDLSEILPQILIKMQETDLSAKISTSVLFDDKYHSAGVNNVVSDSIFIGNDVYLKPKSTPVALNFMLSFVGCNLPSYADSWIKTTLPETNKIFGLGGGESVNKNKFSKELFDTIITLQNEKAVKISSERSSENIVKYKISFARENLAIAIKKILETELFAKNADKNAVFLADLENGKFDNYLDFAGQNLILTIWVKNNDFISSFEIVANGFIKNEQSAEVSLKIKIAGDVSDRLSNEILAPTNFTLLGEAKKIGSALESFLQRSRTEPAWQESENSLSLSCIDEEQKEIFVGVDLEKNGETNTGVVYSFSHGGGVSLASKIYEENGKIIIVRKKDSADGVESIDENGDIVVKYEGETWVCDKK